MLTVGENTYITLLEIDDYMYFSSLPEWFSLPDAPENNGTVAKESYLFETFEIIVNYLTVKLSVNPELKDIQKQLTKYFFQHKEIVEKRLRDVSTGIERTDIGHWEEVLRKENFSMLPVNLRDRLDVLKPGNTGSNFFVTPDYGEVV
jgi:hypothetical protein